MGLDLVDFIMIVAAVFYIGDKLDDIIKLLKDRNDRGRRDE